MDLFIAVYFDDIHSLNRWVGNLWPAGWIRPVRPFHPAREAIPSRQLRQPQACTRFSEASVSQGGDIAPQWAI
ncbi:hypothetical protein M514_05143 [Trichuris suis]|uniref:Uncharacterized protein n=1 Tax=Trichuris suis TaxID=68888 RepID=A0A085MTQ7_9BILA|nr:hypothetical protein M514_05143 [Trichuris suis]